MKYNDLEQRFTSSLIPLLMRATYVGWVDGPQAAEDVMQLRGSGL